MIPWAEAFELFRGPVSRAVAAAAEGVAAGARARAALPPGTITVTPGPGFLRVEVTAPDAMAAEFGTMDQPARPFLGPAAEAARRGA